MAEGSRPSTELRQWFQPRSQEVEGVPSAVLLKQLRMSFSNPARIARRHLFDLGIGADSLLHTDRTKLRVRFSVINLTNKDAL